MIPYFILLIFPVLVYCFSGSKTNRNKYTFVAFTLIFLFLLMFRDETIGCDMPNYHYYFDSFTKDDILDNSHFIEPGFVVFNLLLSSLFSDFQIYMAVIALITVIPLFVFYKNNSKHAVMTILLFMNIGLFSIFFSTVRQILAMTFVLPAFFFTRKKKLVPFLITVALAILFHRSAIILFLMYPLYYIRLPRKSIFYVLPAVIAIFLLKERIFSSSLQVISGLFGGKYGEIQSTGAFASFLLDVLFLLFVYLIPDEKKMTNDQFGMRSFMLLVTVLQSFASVSTIAMRANYYYLIFVPVLMSQVIYIPRPKMRKVSKCAVIVITIFFFFYFMLGAYQASTTDAGDILEIYPYKFFV